jgi:hypothetical protein
VTKYSGLINAKLGPSFVVKIHAPGIGSLGHWLEPLLQCDTGAGSTDRTSRSAYSSSHEKSGLEKGWRMLQFYGFKHRQKMRLQVPASVRSYRALCSGWKNRTRKPKNPVRPTQSGPAGISPAGNEAIKESDQLIIFW